MKRISLQALLVSVAAVVGLSVGIFLRDKASPRPVMGSTTLPAGSRAASKKERPENRLPGDSGLMAQLECDLSISKGVTRWLFWLEAIEQAQPADFPKLAMLARNDPTALRFVAARWSESYPQHLFDTLVQSFKNPGQLPVRELADTLFKVWPKGDPESAIAALNGAEDFGMRNAWRDQVAETVIENDAERGIRLMEEWNIDRFGPRMTAITLWAAADPRHAAEFTLQNPAGYVSELTMETIAKEWTKTDPIAPLGFTASQKGPLALTLANAALREWAGRDLDAAADWLAQADGQVRNRLAPALVEPWAKQDPQSALNWCESNLSGSTLIQAVSSVLKGAADTDVPKAAALVSSLEPSAARAEAAVAVAKKWFPERLSSGEPINPAALVWLGSLDPGSVKAVLDQVVWEWATSDPISLAGFLRSPSATQVTSSVYTVLARQLAAKKPQAALDWANSLSGNLAFEAGGEAYATWRATRADAASQWFNALPQDDPRRQPYFESAVRTLAWNEPQASAQLAAMSPIERLAARSVIEQMTLPEDRRNSLLAALKPH